MCFSLLCSGSASIAVVAPSPPPRPLKTLYVGEPHVCETIKALFATSVSADTLIVLDEHVHEGRIKPFDDKIWFGRDYRITLLSGAILVPYSLFKEADVNLRDISVMSWAFAFFPPCMKHYFEGNGCLYGHGLRDILHKAVVRESTRLGLSYKKGLSSVEGGNCLLFKGAEGRAKALVGLTSLILSHRALSEQGYFEKKREELAQRIKDIGKPSHEFLRYARNQKDWQSREGLLKTLSALKIKAKEGELIERESCRRSIKETEGRLIAPFSHSRLYYASFLEDLTAREKEAKDLADAALKLQAEFLMTGRVIATELNVEAAAFIPHDSFHIDLDMFVAPDGKTVYVHDEEVAANALIRALHLLTVLGQTSGEEGKELSAYYRYAKDHIMLSRRINEEIEPHITALGCRMVKVPGRFMAYGNVKKPLNFMNGVFIGTHFLTNGGSHTILADLFKEMIMSSTPEVKVIFVTPKDNPDLLRTILQRGGGLHCLTWEKHLSPEGSKE